MSSRIGLAGMFYREPINSENLPFYSHVVEGIGGPVVGLATKYADRIPYLLNEGYYARAAEAALPAAFGGMARAVRFYSEGANTLRGDPLVGEFSLSENALQFFGFSPARLIREYERNAMLKGIDKAIVARGSRIRKRYYFAKKNGDRGLMKQVMREVREFNRDNPQAAIDYKSLEKSFETRMRNTSRMHNGVLFSAKNREMLERMSRQFDDAVSVWE